MISICIPARGRPTIFKRFWDSVLDNASHPDNIEVISYHDNDDPSVYEYRGNHVEIIADRQRTPLSNTINECVKLAKGPIYTIAP